MKCNKFSFKEAFMIRMTFFFLVDPVICSGTNTTEISSSDDDGNGEHSVKLIIAIVLAVVAITALLASYYFMRCKPPMHESADGATLHNSRIAIGLSVAEPLDEIQEGQI